MAPHRSPAAVTPLYTPEERLRRDASKWTLVQGILAPIQFLVFLVSLALVLRTLATGEGEGAAMVSVLLKTLVLFAIMFTGALWERDVFGRYLFAAPFFWEDVVSMGVIALHALYVVMVFGGLGGTSLQLQVALAAYLIYLVNAAQFVNKLRLARRAEPPASRGAGRGTDRAAGPAAERAAEEAAGGTADGAAAPAGAAA